MDKLFAPGCALRKYKPHLIYKIKNFLLENGIANGEYEPCCKELLNPQEDTILINCCPGCSHMFETKFLNVRSVTLWKILLNTDFPFPDYHGEKMTIHDSCHARNRNSTEMQIASRELCRRMNIKLVEPADNFNEAKCCGGSAKDYETRKKMALERAKDFPEKNAVVYCTGCVRSFSLTDVHPRHMLDLLFNEPTEGLTVKK